MIARVLHLNKTAIGGGATTCVNITRLSFGQPHPTEQATGTGARGLTAVGEIYFRRQLLVNAAIAASRVAS
jgi:hypothetical protein